MILGWALTNAARRLCRLSQRRTNRSSYLAEKQGLTLILSSPTPSVSALPLRQIVGNVALRRDPTRIVTVLRETKNFTDYKHHEWFVPNLLRVDPRPDESLLDFR